MWGVESPRLAVVVVVVVVVVVMVVAWWWSVASEEFLSSDHRWRSLEQNHWIDRQSHPRNPSPPPPPPPLPLSSLSLGEWPPTLSVVMTFFFFSHPHE